MLVRNAGQISFETFRCFSAISFHPNWKWTWLSLIAAFLKRSVPYKLPNSVRILLLRNKKISRKPLHCIKLKASSLSPSRNKTLRRELIKISFLKHFIQCLTLLKFLNFSQVLYIAFQSYDKKVIFSQIIWKYMFLGRLVSSQSEHISWDLRTYLKHIFINGFNISHKGNLSLISFITSESGHQLLLGWTTLLWAQKD